MTVVGRVTGTQRNEEPVLSLLYVRGWGVSSAHHGVWENFDPQYSLSVPGGLKKNTVRNHWGHRLPSKPMELQLLCTQIENLNVT